MSSDGSSSLSDLTLLVRGGQRGLNADRLRKAAQNADAKLGLLAVSAFADFDRDLEALCRAKRALRVYGSLWVSTAGRLRAAGFAIEQTGRDHAHHSIVLPDLVPSTLGRLRACFTVRSNPLPVTERRKL